MEFVKDPIKSRNVFVVMLILTILFFLGAGAFGYLYYKKNKDYKSLQNERQLSSADLKQQITKLADENATLKQTNTSLEKTLNDKKTQDSKIKTYLDVLNYIAQIVDTHDGLEGISEAEYQEGKAIAEATENDDFVKTLEWAWTRTDLNQFDRLATVLKAIASGISDNLNK